MLVKSLHYLVENMAQPKVKLIYFFALLFVSLQFEIIIYHQADKTDIGKMGETALKEKFSEDEINKGFMEPTTVDRIKFFYKMMDKIGQLNSTKSAKSEEESKKFLDAGSKIMTTGRVDINSMYAAMQLYNKSICFAESVNSPILASSYFNRSEVLSNWKQHHLSLENVALAEVAGLPHEIGAKLKENIQAKKLLAQSNPNEDPSVPKPSQSSPQFPPLELVDEDFAELTIASRSDPIVSTVIPCYSYDKYRDQASLSLKRHAKIPFAANCLDVKFDSKRGRHITTNTDIKPGQIVIIETPFVDAMTTTNDDLYRYTKCTNCYMDKCLSLFTCPSCSTAMFCSEKCIAESKAYHDIECPISDAMIKLAWKDSLALRMTLKAFSVFRDASELTDFCKSYDDDKGQRSPLSYDAQMTDQQRYKQIYGFERKNLPQDPSKLLEDYCKVAFLYHILTTMTKFSEMLKTDEDHNTLMELLYRHIRIANFGGIDLYQYQQFDLMESGFDKPEDLYSKGIYELSSLIKHSCVPNIAIVANGREIIAYCCRPIARGSQLMRSYGK